MRQAEYQWPVPPDHPAFAGHFPGRPILPGVVLLDRALLLAEVFLGRRVSGWQIGQTKFFVPVAPGTLLHYLFQEQAEGRIAFSVRVGEREVAAGLLQPSP